MNTNKNMTKSEEKIYKYILLKGDVRPHDIIKEFSLSQQMVQRVLKKLLANLFIIKKGSSPRVFYAVAKEGTKNVESTREISIDTDYQKIIEENFYAISPDGKEYYGLSGFKYWCDIRNFNIEKYAKEYIEQVRNINRYNNNNGFIDASKKIINSFQSDKRYLDELWYGSFYSLPIFGKTKLAQKLFQAKQTQNIRLIGEVINVTEKMIYAFIKIHKPDAIALVPPTAVRKIQFMKELERVISGILPMVKIEKIANDVMIQQKSLKDINERIINAEKTMIVHKSAVTYKKILIIDDFTGSGSTLNILAQKMKKQHIAKKVIGFTITGSMNGFDVIREV